jgi:hypothetical protein
VVRLGKFVLNNQEYFDADKVDFFQKIMDSTRFVSQGRSVVETTIRQLKLFEVFKHWRGRIENVDELGRYSVRMSEVLQFLASVTAKLIDDTPLRKLDGDGAFRLTVPAGAKHQFGYPDGATVHQLIKKCAQQFVPNGRSVEDALSVAHKQAEAKRKQRQLELDVGTPKAKRKLAANEQPAQKKRRMPLPDIVPPEPNEDDDVVYADDVDDDVDEPIKFTSKGQAARAASAAIAKTKLLQRRQEKKNEKK